MGGESTIHWKLAALNVLPAQLYCAREASSWYFFVLRRWCMALDLQRCDAGSDVLHPGATFIPEAHFYLKTLLFPRINLKTPYQHDSPLDLKQWEHAKSPK